jgi:hypothetical protein
MIDYSRPTPPKRITHGLTDRPAAAKQLSTGRKGNQITHKYGSAGYDGKTAIPAIRAAISPQKRAEAILLLPVISTSEFLAISHRVALGNALVSLKMETPGHSGQARGCGRV